MNNYLVEFDTFVPEFPDSVHIIQKVDDTTFLVQAEKLPQEWIISCKITKL